MQRISFFVFRFSILGFFVFFTHVRAIFANFEGRGLDCEFATFIVFKTLSNSLLCFCLFAIFYFALFCCLCFLQLPSAAIAISVLFYAQFVCPVCVYVCVCVSMWVGGKKAWENRENWWNGLQTETKEISEKAPKLKTK